MNSIATEILSLRRDQTSSVSLLLGAIEWHRAATNDNFKLMRGHAVLQAIDLVLLNVAVHSLEAQENRRAKLTPRRRRRCFDPGMIQQQRQHRLFA